MHKALLVDYASSSSSSEESDRASNPDDDEKSAAQRPQKRRRRDDDAVTARTDNGSIDSKADRDRSATGVDASPRLRAGLTVETSAKDTGRNIQSTGTLPPGLDDLYTTEPRRGDDPAWHGARVRSTNHTAGLYPSHVYLELAPSAALRAQLDAVVARFESLLSPTPPGAGGAERLLHGYGGSGRGDSGKTIVHTFLTDEHGLSDRPLHVSLSPPLLLPKKDIGAFESALCSAIDKGGCIGAARAPDTDPPTGCCVEGEKPTLTLVLGDLDVFTNDDGTRAFLVVLVDDILPASDGHDNGDGRSDGGNVAQVSLSALQACVDEVVARFGHRPLYTHHLCATPIEAHAVGVTPQRRSDERDSDAGFVNGFHKHHISIGWFLPSDLRPAAAMHRSLQPDAGKARSSCRATKAQPWSMAPPRLNDSSQALRSADDPQDRSRHGGAKTDHLGRVSFDGVKLKIGARVHRIHFHLPTTAMRGADIRQDDT